MWSDDVAAWLTASFIVGLRETQMRPSTHYYGPPFKNDFFLFVSLPVNCFFEPKYIFFFRIIIIIICAVKGCFSPLENNFASKSSLLFLRDLFLKERIMLRLTSSPTRLFLSYTFLQCVKENIYVVFKCFQT